MVKRFTARGRWNDTNRIRTETIIATDPEEALKIAKVKGMIEGFDITEFRSSPTQKQIDFARKLGISLTSSMSSEDVSALISRKVDSDNQSPQPGLIQFARQKKLVFSDYIGKKALYDQVFRELDDIDRVAFFIFSIYRYISDDRLANLNEHKHKHKFYEFASLHIHDKKFMSSMNRYDGKSIRFFGTLRVGDQEFDGGSTRTIAFKSARQFLIQAKLIEESSSYQTKNIISEQKQPTKPKTLPKVTTPKKKKIQDKYIDPAQLSKDQTGKSIPRQLEIKPPYKWYLNGWIIFLLVLLIIPTYGLSLIPVFFIIRYREKFRKEYFKSNPKFYYPDD